MWNFRTLYGLSELIDKLYIYLFHFLIFCSRRACLSQISIRLKRTLIIDLTISLRNADMNRKHSYIFSFNKRCITNRLNLSPNIPEQKKSQLSYTCFQLIPSCGVGILSSTRLILLKGQPGIFPTLQGRVWLHIQCKTNLLRKVTKSVTKAVTT